MQMLTHFEHVPFLIHLIHCKTLCEVVSDFDSFRLYADFTLYWHLQNFSKLMNFAAVDFGGFVEVELLAETNMEHCTIVMLWPIFGTQWFCTLRFVPRSVYILEMWPCGP